MHSRSPWEICPWWAQRGVLWPLQATLYSPQCLWFHLSLQKMRWCLSEGKHDPVSPSAREKSWLCRRKVSLRASSARWQLLLLGLERRPLAEAGEVHLNSAGSNDPSEHGWPPIVLRFTKHWALSPEEISFLLASGCILRVFPFRKSLSEQRCTYLLHGVIVGAVLTRHYVMGRAKLIFQTERRKKMKGVTQIRKPWTSEWHFCPSAELCLLSLLPVSQPGNGTRDKHQSHNLVVVNQPYLGQRPEVRRCSLNKEDVGRTVCSSKSCWRPQGHSCKRQCCCIFTASPSPSSICCSGTAWLQWKLSPKSRKLHALVHQAAMASALRPSPTDCLGTVWKLTDYNSWNQVLLINLCTGLTPKLTWHA